MSGGVSVVTQLTVSSSPPAGPGTHQMPEATPEPLLPDPSQLGVRADPGAMMAVLILKMAREQRQTGTVERQLNETVQRHEEQAQLEAMRAEADNVRGEGFARGAGELVSGALEISSGVASGTGHADVAKSLSGAGKMADGTATFIATGYKAAEKLEETAAMQHGMDAGHAKLRVEDANDGIKDAADLSKRAIDFYREYVTAESQAQAAALHRS